MILVPMLKNTDRLFDRKMDSACGVFEHVPFKTKNLTQYYQDIHYAMQLKRLQFLKCIEF